MKKLFISLVAVVFSLSAMATSTAAARIKLVGSNTTYAVSTLFLNEDDARNSSYESGYDAERMMDQANPFSVLIYAFVENIPCERVETDNLDRLVIGFTTNKKDADYTLQFSNVSGRELSLYDRVTKSTTIITEGESYAFSVDPSLVGQVAVKDRFVLNFTPVAIKGTGAWYEKDFDVDLAPALDGKTASGNIEFAAEQKGEWYNFKVLRGEEWLSNAQGFTRANNSQVVNATEDDNMYFEIDLEGIYQFIWTFATQNLKIIFPTPTAVDNVEAGVQAKKFVENGQIYIRRGNEVFNLQGQEVK